MSGYKGIDIVLDGRPLVSHVIERFCAEGSYGPAYIAGPERLYGGVPGCEVVVDTDGSFAENVYAAIDAVRSRHPEGPLAITTSDILPDPAELRTTTGIYRENPECSLFYPICRLPEDVGALGAFGWKPKYCVRVEGEADPVPFLPGHLVIFDPEAIRLRFLYDVVQIAYRTRNRSIGSRRGRFVRVVLGGLLYHDLLHVLRLRVPSLTYTILRNGLAVARGLRRGMPIRDLERACERVLIKWRYRRRQPERGVRLPLVDAITLAEDIDTEEEAKAIGAGIRRGPVS